MPLPMIHLSTAVKINILQRLKSPEFYLGSISPDAVHMRSGFVREDKIRSHCNARELTAIGELGPLCIMIEKSTGKEREFLLGYLVHILTDLLWENTILKMYGERYEADPSPIQDRRMGYYNDTDQLDFVFYEKENWRTEVWEMLTQAKDFAVEGAVNKDEVAAWKYRTLNWYNSGKSQHTNPVKYISYEDLDRFTSYAAEKCEEYLQSKGFGDFEISG